MKLKIPYKKDAVEIEIPDSLRTQIVEPNDVPEQDERRLIIDAIAHPVGSPTFDEFVADADDLLFIINDSTRPTPTSAVIDALYDSIKDKKVSIIIATGVHRAATPEELRRLIGSHYEDFKENVHSHDSEHDEMVYLGTSSNGTEMYINKIAMDAGKVIVIGSVEPHYFAGYTGGRKGFLPGVASYQTIEMNHKHALKPEAVALALEGNPVHEDMMDAMKCIKKDVFAIMTVLNKHHGCYAVTAGGLNESFYAAIDKANEVFVADVKEKTDIVISVAKYPMDINLYQSQKALDNGKLVLKKGGILILISSCREGVGEQAFVDLLSSCDSPQAVLDRIEQTYKLGYHKAGKMAEINLWASVWTVSDMADEIWNSIFIKPFASIQCALNEAVRLKGSDASLTVLLDGCITVPRVTN
ncbi:MAG: nickel-dependent lactate racemase [Spartobacteria bacterium]|nr:nickel-dependent lactate racemase [Spartobacteria bacterium]